MVGVASRVDQALNIGLHDDLQCAFGNRAQKISVSALPQKLGKRSSVLGHRDQLIRWCEVWKLHLANEPGGHRDRNRLGWACPTPGEHLNLHRKLHQERGR
jgi:hypothetical protein